VTASRPFVEDVEVAGLGRRKHRQFENRTPPGIGATQEAPEPFGYSPPVTRSNSPAELLHEEIHRRTLLPASIDAEHAHPCGEACR
jgi:hypothetical protein